MAGAHRTDYLLCGSFTTDVRLSSTLCVVGESGDSGRSDYCDGVCLGQNVQPGTGKNEKIRQNRYTWGVSRHCRVVERLGQSKLRSGVG